MKVVSFEKLSKKAQKEINNSKRASWNGLNPTTKVVESKKAYSRKEKHPKQYC